MSIALKLLSSLEKVFLDEEPVCAQEELEFTMLRNENFSFQVACTTENSEEGFLKVSVKTDLPVTLREVRCVPCEYPAHSVIDDNYLKTSPGLYPDLLRIPEQGLIHILPGQWRSLWIEVDPKQPLQAGNYPVEIQFLAQQTGEERGRIFTTIEVLDAMLPEQKLIHTQWFHGDCLATYYQIPVFSEQHWEIMEHFIQTAVKRGINMILTPQFTPPLDTAKGGERPTIQLVDVTENADGSYQFGFEKLERWVKMCQKAGIRYFEMSHLFTQWGAIAAPKVMGYRNGEYLRLFGWETPAVGGEYTGFLRTYLPQLTEKLRELGIAQQTYFHISDEPTLSQLDSYQTAKESIADLLQGFHLMDALSDYEFYKTGAVEIPVCANNHINPFLEHQVSPLWSYYCTGQYEKVSNRFFSMPSARNRIYGVQLFRYDIQGILHWGYNFYYSQYSLYPIDPYQITDSAGNFPGGDPFMVYPGKDGYPEESLRLVVHHQALEDLRALEALSEKIGKQKVIQLLEQGLEYPLTFEQYPKSAGWLITIRNQVNRLLAEK